MLFILVLLLLALTLDCNRITESENDVIREKCGVRSLIHFPKTDWACLRTWMNMEETLSPRHTHSRHGFFHVHPKAKASFKIHGGRSVSSGEYPWMVHITVWRHLEGDTFSSSTCAGSLISPRHVLTAAHCVVADYNTEQDSQCHGREPTVKPQDLEVYTGTSCSHQRRCGSLQRVRKVIAHGNWTKCAQFSLYSDFAILEFEKNINYEEAVPICLPSENLRLQRDLQAAGSGIDEKSNDPGLKVATLTLKAEERSKAMILTSSKNASACGGDSGGPLFQLGPSGRFVIVGVLSGGFGTTPGCKKPDEVNTWGDVRQRLKWICTHTGVCPKAISVKTTRGR